MDAHVADNTTPATIRLEGLAVFAHHGAVAEERSLGQRFEFDVELSISDCAACRTDLLDDSIGYEQVAELIVDVSGQFSFHTLEALAEAVCVELMTEFDVERVWLRARKPAPPMRYSVAWTSVEVERHRTSPRETWQTRVGAVPDAAFGGTIEGKEGR